MTSGHITTSAGKIAYRQSAGTGPTIVLVHGNSASSKAFARQLDGTLGRTYRVIAYDLPGHGKSDDAADPAKTYTMPGYARVLREVAAQLGADDAVFVGWSLGGHIVLEAAPDLPDAKGFAIFGTPPLAFPPAMEQAFLPTPAMAFTFAPELSDEQARAYVAAAFKPDATDLPAEMVADVLRTDGRARANLAASIAPGGFRDEIEVVASLRQPLAILHGAETLYLLREHPTAAHMAVTLTGIGVRMPAHLTASGRAMLAHLPAAQVRALFPSDSAFVNRTGHGPTSLPELRRVLQHARRQGWADEVGLITPGLQSVAACAFDHTGHPAAAFSVTLRQHGSHLPATELVRAVQTAAQQLTSALSGRPPQGWLAGQLS